MITKLEEGKKGEKAVVEYSKDFALSMNNYSAYEMDLILALAYSARKSVKDHKNVSEEKDLSIELSAVTIKKILQGNTSMKRLSESIEKVFDTKIYFMEDDYKVSEHIFKRLCFSTDSKKIIFVLRKKYIHLFFNLTGNFTQHELLEFASLKGKYAKKIYQIVMSYGDLGKKEYSGDLFRKLLNIPETYRWTDIDNKVIKTVKNEFSKKTNIIYFDFKKEKIKTDVDKVILSWKIQKPEIILENSKKESLCLLQNEVKNTKRKKEIINIKDILEETFETNKKEDVYNIPIKELSSEEEKEGIKLMLEKGYDMDLIKTMGKELYINTIRYLLYGEKSD